MMRRYSQVQAPIKVAALTTRVGQAGPPGCLDAPQTHAGRAPGTPVPPGGAGGSGGRGTPVEPNLRPLM